MIDDHALAKKAYVILMNELLPRAKKCGQTVEEFIPSEVAAAFIRGELDGIMTRRETRKLLDIMVEIRTHDDTTTA